jgi:hypothetical protein
MSIDIDELKEYMDSSYKHRMSVMLKTLIKLNFPNVKEVVVEPTDDGLFNISISGGEDVSKEEVEEYIERMKKEFEIKPPQQT